MMRIRRIPREARRFKAFIVAFLLVSPSAAFLHTLHRQSSQPKPPLSMVLTSPETKKGIEKTGFDGKNSRRNKVRRKYKRQRIPESEKDLRALRKERQKEYEQIMSNADGGSPSIWSFESLFPDPVWDEKMVKRDLYETKKQDKRTSKSREKNSRSTTTTTTTTTREVSKMRSSFYGGSSMLRVWREPKLSSSNIPNNNGQPNKARAVKEFEDPAPKMSEILSSSTYHNITGKVDLDLTRMVEDRIYGYRRTATGMQYDTSLMGDGAVKFRDGVRLGNPMPINADRLNYFAKKELQHGRVEEAQELLEQAIQMDPRDGRAYLGLSRCAERRRDFVLARTWLQTGINNAVSLMKDMTPDRGANPFLLQALGRLEEKMGRLSEAEALYISAAKSRPSHAAAWVSLAQLRTRKLGQSASAGRVCYQTAERELKKAGLRPSSHVYTAWADLEYKKAGDTRKARELYNSALKVDPKCSVAWLQLGVMEADCKNWKEAESCFEKVLKYDQRNSRVLQAYALMESKRPSGHSRKAIGLFERALKANSRDAGVLQAYALYVRELGDIEAARRLLRRGTGVNKRYAPCWQAWGVLETQHGTAEEARTVFQQGIWACAQLTGNQSGGYHCARLWQAWGVLEAREGDHAAARRCFSRALDADSRNIAAITAWAQMEEELDNDRDARAIFERALHKFAAGSDEKTALWRSYELMYQRLGNVAAAQQVFRRSMREVITLKEESIQDDVGVADSREEDIPVMSEVLSKSKEVEVVRWDGGSLGGEVWLNDRAIEGKVPFNLKKRKKP